jgi:hypothetical protein
MFFGRGKNKIQNVLTLKDSYLDYIKDKDECSPYYITELEYRTINEDYILLLNEEILTNASIFKMPYRLGTLQVVKLQSSNNRNKKYSIDFNLTNKYGKTIYHLNEHSDGYKYMFRWSKIKSVVKNKTKYRFIPTRTNKRALANNIKLGIIDYFEA